MSEISSANLLDVIEDMIVEYSNMAYDNNHRFPSDEERDLVRLGHYGEQALVDLKKRIAELPLPSTGDGCSDVELDVLRRVRDECRANGYWHLPATDAADALLDSKRSEV